MYPVGSNNWKMVEGKQEGWTPLHVAVQSGRTDIIKLLLRRGADINILNQVILANRSNCYVVTLQRLYPTCELGYLPVIYSQ
jgi:hypothetical protein